MVSEIRERINSETGEAMEKKTKEIGKDEAATIIFESQPMVVERFSEIPKLGRFILARNEKIGAGIVLEVAI